MITATFDLTTGWAFNGDPDTSFGISFSDGDAERITPTDLHFGYTLTVNGTETDTHTWPPDYMTIRELTRQRIFNYRTPTQPDDEITVDVWAENGGTRVEDQTVWIVPRPAQPYPSWTWVDGRWEAPVMYPDSDSFYTWDEETTTWIEVTDDSA